MYIINPLHKEGRAATDLTSTHPPISERVRILRAMAGGAGWSNYEAAYESVKKGTHLFSKTQATSVGVVGIRAATAPSAEEKDLAVDKAARSREASDVMLKVNQYRTVDCECGTRWKIPPGFTGDSIQCTRCGRTLKV
jgi:heat shock protein HtpX